jgi:hypothetical protein
MVFWQPGWQVAQQVSPAQVVWHVQSHVGPSQVAQQV